jgi:hypothetical protein
MSNVKVEVKTLDDLQPDPNNVNKHSIRGHQLVENSLRKRGAFRSVAAAGKGVDKPVVMAGNLTIEKARDAGIDEVIFVHTNGRQLVSVIRDDIEPGSAEAIALGLEDNETAHKSYSPDLDVLAAVAEGDNAILSALRANDKVFDGMVEGMTPQQIDYQKEWEGMPEFEQEDKTAFQSIHIHFKTQGDVDNFAELTGQKITNKTRSIWYPKIEIERYADKRYSDES